MTTMSLKRRIYAPLAGAVALLLGTALVLLLAMRERDLREAREQDRVAVERLVENDAAGRTRMMEGVLAGLLADPELEAAFRSRDRARLFAAAAPLFDGLREQRSITRLSFIGPGRDVVLRVHQPDRFDDRIDRELMREAERTQAIATGLELGVLPGLPARRLVAPWRRDGELLGYIELGDEIGGLAGQIRAVLGLHAFLVLDKERITRGVWESQMRAAGRTLAWDRYERVVLVDGTLPLPPPELDARFVAMGVPGQAQVVSANVDGSPYQGEAIALVDAGRQMIGELVFLRDRRRMLAAFNRGLAGFVMLFVLTGLALWLGLRRVVQKHVLRPLQELRGVTEGAGRGQLVETLLAERGDEMGDLGRAVNRLIGELRASQDESTREIVDATHDAVVIADMSGVIVGWNSRAEAIFGWSREEALGMTLTESVIPEDQHAPHLAGMRRFREGGTGPMVNRRVELTARRRTGELFPAEVTVTPIQAADGVTLAAFIRDITDRREAERAFRISEERFRRLVETANVVPWEASSRTTRVTYAASRGATRFSPDRLVRGGVLDPPGSLG